MQPNHRPWEYFLKSVSGLSYKNIRHVRHAAFNQMAPAAGQLPVLGMRAPKYNALLTPTAPITAQKITQIHGLHGIRPISNSGVILAHAA